MNSILDQKIAKLVERIEAQDIQVLKAGVQESDDNIRAAIDKRRSLIAMLERQLMAKTGKESANVEQVYRGNKDITQFIRIWCDQIRQVEFDRKKFENLDYCHRILDAFLPESWDWNKDLVLLTNPVDETIFRALRSRGQRNVLAFFSEKITIDQNRIQSGFERAILTSDYMILADGISKINTRVRHVTTLHCDPTHPQISEIAEKVQDALKLGRKTAQINVNTNTRFAESWGVNILKNVPNLARNPNLADIKFIGKNDAVVVSPGPSLQKNIEELKKVQDRFVIVTVLRAAKILNDYGIKPDLVVQIDALSDEEADNFAKNPLPKVKNLYLEGAVNPTLFEIDAEVTIWSLLQNIPEVHDVLNTQPTPFSAPSVSLYAAHLCQHLGMRSICLLGQDLSATKDAAYMEGATSILKPSAEAWQFNLPTRGFWGGTVNTRHDFAYYIEQYSILAEQWKHVNPNLLLVNATEGGAFLDGFDHKTFSDHIQDLKATAEGSNKVLVVDTARAISEELLEQFHQKLEYNLSNVSKIAHQIIKLDNERAFGNGKSKKIQKLVRKFSDLNKNTSLLELSMQSEITQTVGNSKETSTIPSYAEFFEKVDKKASNLRSSIQYACGNGCALK
jgi:hypothetical protein